MLPLSRVQIRAHVVPRLKTRTSIFPPSPPEKPVRVIHLLRLIEVESLEPPLLRSGGSRVFEPTEERCGAGCSHVGKEARHEERRAAESTLQVIRLFGIEMPGGQLAED